MRKKLYSILATSNDSGKINDAYDFFMIATIIISIIPLAFKESNALLEWIDHITVCIFIVDYFLRFITADHQFGKGGYSFFLYPISPMAVIDMLAILPSVTMLNNGLKMLKVIRLLRTLKVLRSLKFLRYSKSFELISNVFKKQKKILSAVATMAVAYILISALIIYNVEPDSFENFFDAVYWATISLTTVGYGDIYPVTTAGRIVTMVSSALGIVVIALPSGVITAGYLEEISKKDKDE